MKRITGGDPWLCQVYSLDALRVIPRLGCKTG
jgi:hypothetical protein